MKKTWRWIFMIGSVFCLQLELLQNKDVEKLNYTIPQVQSDNLVFSEEIDFEELSYNIVEEKIAINPHFIYTEENQTIYALNDKVSVYDSPNKDKQKLLFEISKRESLNSLGYNSFNDTYKIQSQDNQIYYVNAQDFITDINLIFDNVEGIRYLNDDKISLKDYPSSGATKIKTLDVNSELTLLLKNNNGYYKVKIGEIEGYIHEDYLSKEKVNYISPMQKKVAELAYKSLTKNQGTYPARAGYCAAWVSGLYEAAGLKRPAAHAIDYWTKWKSSGSTDMNNIPIGAAVVASGSSNPTGGMIYGHVGIYIGDTNGDGEGEVIDNIGYIDHWELSDWLSWQTTPVYHYSSGKKYGPGFIGWVWPHGEPLGSGI